MTANMHTSPQGRVGARYRSKLKKWSDKVGRRDDAASASFKRPALRRRRTLDAARAKLRELFH